MAPKRKAVKKRAVKKAASLITNSKVPMSTVRQMKISVPTAAKVGKTKKTFTQAGEAMEIWANQVVEAGKPTATRPKKKKKK